MKQINAVNSFLIKDNSICLGMKKTGHGEGKWNGFGGKIETGESAEDAAVREIFEECGVRVKKNGIEKVAIVKYIEPKGNWTVSVFLVSGWSGVPQESNEMNPKWFPIKEIPYNKMWANDSIWLPMILNGEKFNVEYRFDESGKLINSDYSTF